MVGAGALLAVLDGAILSASPDLTRIAFALVVTVLVGGAILAIWRSNSKLEKAALESGRSSPGGKPDGGGRAPSKSQKQ